MRSVCENARHGVKAQLPDQRLVSSRDSARDDRSLYLPNMARGRIELPTRGFSETDTDFATDYLRFDLFAVTPEIRSR